MIICLQATTTTDEIMFIVSSTDPPECANLPIMQSQKSITQPKEAQEERPLSTL